MSRKGRLPIELPSGVEVKVDPNQVSVKGPKGTLTQELMRGIKVEVQDKAVVVSVDEKTPDAKNFHGLYRSLIDNMVIGTTTGFQIELEMIGVGYRAAVKGKAVDVQVGLSHPMLLTIPEGIEIKVEKNTQITVSGTDKQKVGQFAASIRAVRPPEPYKGKGIRYKGEYVRKKAGKAAK